MISVLRFIILLLLEHIQYLKYDSKLFGITRYVLPNRFDDVFSLCYGALPLLKEMPLSPDYSCR